MNYLNDSNNRGVIRIIILEKSVFKFSLQLENNMNYLEKRRMFILIFLFKNKDSIQILFNFFFLIPKLIGYSVIFSERWDTLFVLETQIFSCLYLHYTAKCIQEQ